MMRIMTFVIALVATEAKAQLFCTKPIEPRCVTAFGTFDDDWAFDRCKRELNDFVAATKIYIDCLNSERDEAIRQTNEVISRFNCKARREIVCR